MTSNNTLIIINSNTDISLNLDNYNNYVYSINNGTLVNDNAISLNSYKKFHKIAFNIRNKYIEFVGNFNQYFKNNYNFHGKNLFYFTDVSTKRTEYIKNYDYICHILMIKNILKEKDINNIIYYNTPDEFINIINSFSNVKKIILKKYFNKNFYWNKIIIRQLIYLFKLLFIKFISSIFFKKKIHIIKNYFFSTYPKNFQFSNHIKYGDFIKNESCYILSFLTDNVHQKINLISFFKIIQKIKKDFNNKYIISDCFINYSDILFFIKVNFKCLNFFQKKFISQKIENIDFSQLIRCDIKNSYERVTRLSVISLSYQRLAKQIKHNSNFYYYLFEYPYGRMLSLSFTKKNINRIGFQHGPSGYLKMICFLSKEDNQYLYSNNLTPNLIMVEDKISFEIYQLGLFKNLSIMKEIYRLNYLKKIKRTNLINKTHLIACGLHDGLMILRILIKSIKANKNINYILKLHPKASNSKILELVRDSKLENLKIADNQIEYYLERIDKVYFSYTSVGNEAAFLGINNEIVYSDFKLNESVFCKEENFI